MNETTIGSKRVFEGRLFKVDSLEVRMDSGRTSAREVVRHPGAAAAICETGDGQFVFVRQYRKAVEKEMLEIVAGIVEDDESAEACVVREIGEETGYGVEKLTRLGKVYPSPGYTDEQISLYYARLREWDGCPEADEDEDIDVEQHNRDQVELMILSGEVEDAKTISSWFLYERALQQNRI